MKTVRTILGTRRIESGNREVTVFQVREILNEQRKMLINRMLSDLQTYIDYRFGVKADADKLTQIREKLDSMKSYTVDLEKYDDIINQIIDHDNNYVGTGAFYKDIDENIEMYLKEIPLTLVK
jgi:hypothetical protein